jgi:hypothetical protein
MISSRSVTVTLRISCDGCSTSTRELSQSISPAEASPERVAAIVADLEAQAESKSEPLRRLLDGNRKHLCPACSGSLERLMR